MIELFEDTGSLYVLNQSIATNRDFIVGSVSFAMNNQLMAYGGIRGRLKTLEMVNGTYELKESHNIRAFLYEVKMEPEGLYSIIITNTPSIEVMYRCPAECLNCSFPNNCSACVAGYHLEGVKCKKDYTNCVLNRMLKGDICEEYCHRKCKTCN